jgi:hypothetical protein
MTNRIRITLVTVSSVLVLYIFLGGLLGKSESNSEKTYRDLGVYSEVLNRINLDYVTEPDLKKVTDGAIRGLLEALDPYSTYFTPAEYQEYLKHPDPGPADVGIFLSKRSGYVTVVSVLPGSPAEKAGVRAGDLIDRVDGTPTRELSVVQIERLLAGAPDTSVKLYDVRGARGEPEPINVTRAVLNYPPVMAKVLEDGDGYLRVSTFDSGKAKQIASQIKELQSSGAHKIILDLRNCAGGNVQEAVDTASLFLDKGLLTFWASVIPGRIFPPTRPEPCAISPWRYSSTNPLPDLRSSSPPPFWVTSAARWLACAALAWEFFRKQSRSATGQPYYSPWPSITDRTARRSVTMASRPASSRPRRPLPQKPKGKRIPRTLNISAARTICSFARQLRS